MVEIDEILLKEYDICNHKAQSYVAAAWQIGAILIAATFLMLGYSIQIFPKTVGILLIPLSWVTLITWWKINIRFNWIVSKAFIRARAIEEFLTSKHPELLSIKKQEKEQRQ